MNIVGRKRKKRSQDQKNNGAILNVSHTVNDLENDYDFRDIYKGLFLLAYMIFYWGLYRYKKCEYYPHIGISIYFQLTTFHTMVHPYFPFAICFTLNFVHVCCNTGVY